MMMDIFSNFDPYWFNLCYMTMVALLSPLFITMIMYWSTPNNMLSFLAPVKSYIISQIHSTKMKSIKGMSAVITTLFIFIIFINLTGMLPYMFSVTSHIIFTVSMGLPIWMSMIIMSLFAAPKKTIAHFLPDGAPDWLNPFLVLIETISISVRPLTLSFRLAANMTAGHVVLTLMSSFSVTQSLNMLWMIGIVSMGYIMFELGICLIQAYIFCLLLTLYSNDHA